MVGRAWTLFERIALRVSGVMFPLLMLVLFGVLLLVALVAFGLIGLAIVGAM